MATKKAEEGIREYLAALEAASAPVKIDREGIKALQEQLAASSDPLEKLNLATQIVEKEQGERPDLSGPEAVFIAEAKGYAEGANIPVSAFQMLGVPDDVLTKAGFTVEAAKGKAKAKGAKASGGARAPRLDPETDVLPKVAGLGAEWKIAELAEAIGRDATTTRNYVMKLIDAGKIAEVGDDPTHDGRGRAPKVYKLA